MDSENGALKIARLLSYGIGLIFVLLPFHEFLVIWLGSHTGHLDLIRIWKEILIALMAPAALWLAWRSSGLRHWLLHSWIARLYFAYLVLSLALGFWALHSHQVNGSALIYGLLVNLRFIGFFLICGVVAAYDKLLKDNWPKLIIGPAAVVIIFGLLQKNLLPYDFLKHFGYGSKTIPAYETVDNNLKYLRVGSTLRGANPLGAYLVLIISAAATWLRAKSVPKFVYLLAALICLFYTYSRSAWIGLILSLAAAAYIGRRRLNSRLIYGLVAAAVILAGGFYLLRHHQSIQDTLLHTSNSSSSQLSSNQERSSAIKGGLRDIAHQPLGRGPGTAGPASFRNSGHPARIAEDYYLQIGQEVGVAGLLIFLAINVLVAWELWQRRADSLARVLLASLIGISFINLLSHAWADDTLSLLWWGLAGIACAPAILSLNKSKNEKA